jgi:hypothetical protein
MTLDIHINEGFIPMVGGALVYHCGFDDRRTAGPEARTRHDAADIHRRRPDCGQRPRIAAPAPGTYLFAGPGNELVERTLGLYGGLVVIDPRNAWRLSPGLGLGG